MGTLWSPDTCDCQIEYDLDEGVEATIHDFRNVKVHQRCKLHEQFDGIDLLAVVLDRNRTKNYVYMDLVEQGVPRATLMVRYESPDSETLLVTGHNLKQETVEEVVRKFPGKIIKVD